MGLGMIYIREGSDFSLGPIYHNGTSIFSQLTFTPAVETGETATNGLLIDVDGTVTNGLYIDNDGTMTTGIKIDGAMTDGISMSGAFATHAINFDSVTLSTTLIGAGSYSSPIDQSCTTGLVDFASTSDDDAFRIGLGIYMKGTGSGTKVFPLCVQAEYNGTAGTDRIQAAQLITYFGSAGEAAKLKTLDGDPTAGAYSLWAKITSNVNAVFDSGCRAAPIWVDNQINAVVSGEEYGIFFSCGGSKVDAVMGFETTSSGWSNFLYFDETAYDQDPVGSATISGGTNDKYLKVDINGTAYGIPLYHSW